MKVGDAVNINSIDNFGGPAHIIAIRESEHTNYRVAMLDQVIPPFWAHNFEVSSASHVPLTTSEISTHEHILLVQSMLNEVIIELRKRSNIHDLSKLQSPEKEIFEEYTPKLNNCTYGSEEYKEYLVAMSPALEHHYANNSHHPEYYDNGIKGMSLIDIVEMFCDWKAATLRHKDGNIRRSIEINQKRFGYTDELKQIFLNTLND